MIGCRQALERIARPDHNSAIHVQLPSYRDCELKNTILALRGMAADPERVHIAVCCVWHLHERQKVLADHGLPFARMATPAGACS